MKLMLIPGFLLSFTNCFASTLPLSASLCGKDAVNYINSHDIAPVGGGTDDEDNIIVFGVSQTGNWVFIEMGKKKDNSDTCIMGKGTNFVPMSTGQENSTPEQSTPIGPNSSGSVSE